MAASHSALALPERRVLLKPIHQIIRRFKSGTPMWRRSCNENNGVWRIYAPHSVHDPNTVKRPAGNGLNGKVFDARARNHRVMVKMQ